MKDSTPENQCVKSTCLERSLLPPEVRKPDGFILRCPQEWK